MSKVLIFYPDRCNPPSIANYHAFDGIKVLPGRNSKLRLEQIEKLEKHPALQSYIACGAIQIIEGEEAKKIESELVETPASSDLESLSEFTLEQINTILETTTSLETLQGWLGKERRRNVINALNTRIQAIKTGNA